MTWSLVVLALLAWPAATLAQPPGPRGPSIDAARSAHRDRLPRRHWHGPGWPILRQGYESYTGAPFQGIEETICVPRAEALADHLTFVHPDLGPAYLCRRLPR
jgi:hypothetical protein